jgi:hypothetical protein
MDKLDFPIQLSLFTHLESVAMRYEPCNLQPPIITGFPAPPTLRHLVINAEPDYFTFRNLGLHPTSSI